MSGQLNPSGSRFLFFPCLSCGATLNCFHRLHLGLTRLSHAAVPPRTRSCRLDLAVPTSRRRSTASTPVPAFAVAPPCPHLCLPHRTTATPCPRRAVPAPASCHRVTVPPRPRPCLPSPLHRCAHFDCITATPTPTSPMPTLALAALAPRLPRAATPAPVSAVPRLCLHCYAVPTPPQRHRAPCCAPAPHLPHRACAHASIALPCLLSRRTASHRQTLA